LPLHKHPAHEVPKGAERAGKSNEKPGEVRTAGPHYDPSPNIDAGNEIHPHRHSPPATTDRLFAWDSPGLWAIFAIFAIGLFNMLGPKHTGGFAIAAAVGMVF